MTSECNFYYFSTERDLADSPIKISEIDILDVKGRSVLTVSFDTQIPEYMADRLLLVPKDPSEHWPIKDETIPLFCYVYTYSEALHEDLKDGVLLPAVVVDWGALARLEVARQWCGA